MENKVVTVSGYFDPIHIGHLEYFKYAKKLGNYLVVIVLLKILHTKLGEKYMSLLFLHFT